MAIYHDVEYIWRIIITSDFCIAYTTTKKYYSGEPVHVQGLSKDVSLAIILCYVAKTNPTF